MIQNRNSTLCSTCALDNILLIEFGELWAEAESLWNLHQDTPPFHGYVSADYMAVYESLSRLRGSVISVLEWGSGLGVVTIMASRMGFEAYGIESEASLVSHSESLAISYGSKARFAQGSFIPNEFVCDPSKGSEVVRTDTNTASAYDEFDLQLNHFDLVYAYPWPKEQTLYRNIMQDCGRKDAMLLTYDIRAGVNLVQFGGT
jgi:hypothetical protein